MDVIVLLLLLLFWDKTKTDSEVPMEKRNNSSHKHLEEREDQQGGYQPYLYYKNYKLSTAVTVLWRLDNKAEEKEESRIWSI